MLRQPRLLFGTSAVVTTVLDQCARFARTRDPIVVLGARGTGKTALAGRIHMMSARPGPFVEESAAGLPRDMEVARLTGHVKGAFTDAREDRAGLLEGANGGTFFLDEVQLASAQLQGVLLGLLEKSAIRRIGENRDRPIDVRLLVASNEDLDLLVSEGRFRADLRDRFGYMVVRLPSLVERRDEIVALAAGFLAEATQEQGLHEFPTMSPAMQDLLRSSAWPGNIRQLRAVIRTALALAAPRTQLGVEDLPLDFVAPLGDLGRTRYIRAAAQPADRRPQPAPAELATRIQEALVHTGGNRSAAARMLQISRTQLYRHLPSGRRTRTPTQRLAL